MTVKSFAQFLLGHLFSGSSNILEMNTLSYIFIADISSEAEACRFMFLMVPFDEETLLILIRSNLLFFLLRLVLLRSVLENFAQPQGHEGILSVN